MFYLPFLGAWYTRVCDASLAPGVRYPRVRGPPLFFSESPGPRGLPSRGGAGGWGGPGVSIEFAGPPSYLEVRLVMVRASLFLGSAVSPSSGTRPFFWELRGRRVRGALFLGSALISTPSGRSFLVRAALNSGPRRIRINRVRYRRVRGTDLCYRELGMLVLPGRT